MFRNIQVYKIIQRGPNKINKKTYNQVLLWDVCLHNNKNLCERRVQKLKAFSFIIANGRAWRWCLPKWAALPGRATRLEPQAMSRAHRPPRQLCERPPPTRHRHTDQVSGDTYQPYTYRIHQWGREGKGKKAEQLNACCLKQTAPHTAETTSTCESRNPVCHLNAPDSQTTADQHWLDFNLA